MLNPVTRSALGSLSLLSLVACGAGGDVEEQLQAGQFESSTSQAAQLVLACSGCHSDQAGAIASLNDYPTELLRESLLTYKTDATGSTVMHRLARGYTEADIELISAYLGTEGAL